MEREPLSPTSHDPILREVDWDILIQFNGPDPSTALGNIQEYIAKTYEFPKFVDSETFNQEHLLILPQERFEDAQLADAGFRNLTPLIRSMGGKGLYREREPLSPTNHE